MAAALGLTTMSYSYPSLPSAMYQNPEFLDQIYASNGSNKPRGCEGYSEISSSSDVLKKFESVMESRGNEDSNIKTDTQCCSRIGFRTKSVTDILDDGFKWRKYGKKAVKNSPNPRNYYRCTMEGCKVKKRVERDRNDPSYVITTYDGVHNHLSPGTVLYENYKYIPHHGNDSPSFAVSSSWSNQESYSF